MGRLHVYCFGLLPTASSRRPVKRYNLLVPDIFPRSEPPFQDKVDSSIDRKIKKLADYLDKNPHRAPKASQLAFRPFIWCKAEMSYCVGTHHKSCTVMLCIGLTPPSQKDTKGAESSTIWLCETCCPCLHAFAGRAEE